MTGEPGLFQPLLLKNETQSPKNPPNLSRESLTRPRTYKRKLKPDGIHYSMEDVMGVTSHL